MAIPGQPPSQQPLLLQSCIGKQNDIIADKIDADGWPAVVRGVSPNAVLDLHQFLTAVRLSQNFNDF